MNPTPPATSDHRPIEIVLPIAGMTCASCVNRIERFLGKTDGVVEANVNLATERATVTVDPAVAGRAEVVAAIAAAGYDVRPETAATSPLEDDPEDLVRQRERRTLLVEAVASIAVALALMVMMFWPQTAIPLTTLNRIALIPATFIQFWAGRRFYVAALRAARHGTTNMDTLVAIGTSAAWGYSVVIALFPSLVEEAGLHPETYFDSATIIIGLVLLGRWLESRAKDQTRGAIRRLDRAPAAHGSADRGRPRDRRAARGGPRRRPGAGPARREGAGRRGRGRGPGLDRRVDADRRAAAGRGRPGRPGHRRHDGGRRHARRADDARRPRQRARLDRRAGPAGAGLEGADPAPCRPDQRGLRPVRAGRRRGHVRRLVAGRSRAAAHVRADRVHRRGRHRLPVRDGPRHADGGHGRDRPRGGDGDPDPERGRAGGRRARSTRSSWTRPGRSPAAARRSSGSSSSPASRRSGSSTWPRRRSAAASIRSARRSWSGPT